MPSDRTGDVTYHSWCEHNSCNWERETSGDDSLSVQEYSAWKMVSHGIDTGHYKTYHEEVKDV